MKLLTKSLEKKLRDNSSAQDGSKSFAAVVKLFNPAGTGTWYLSELDDNGIAYGLCDLGDPELGYVSIDELSRIKGAFGLGIERDRSFDANKLKLEDIKSTLDAGGHV